MTSFRMMFEHEWFKGKQGQMLEKKAMILLVYSLKYSFD